MYILYLWLSVSLCKMRAHDRAMQPPAQPRLVACLGLIARLQLLLQLPHQPLWVARVRRLLILVVPVCDYAAYWRRISGKVPVCVLTKLVKKWDVFEFFFLEW